MILGAPWRSNSLLQLCKHYRETQTELRAVVTKSTTLLCVNGHKIIGIFYVNSWASI
ncbi:uncharacterized protein Dvir_GJ25594 [Drosophila virilis]|uniref:Uncharacterized protein n=1 Tax=Drosophila virilis TaxID=7244 RepID=A0A0Q9WMV8_DROVI|nr:uncharacterized protein Dvir_GJ25594 [Drosophila virilis]